MLYIAARRHRPTSFREAAMTTRPFQPHTRSGDDPMDLTPLNGTLAKITGGTPMKFATSVHFRPAPTRVLPSATSTLRPGRAEFPAQKLFLPEPRRGPPLAPSRLYRAARRTCPFLMTPGHRFLQGNGYTISRNRPARRHFVLNNVASDAAARSSLQGPPSSSS